MILRPTDLTMKLTVLPHTTLFISPSTVFRPFANAICAHLQQQARPVFNGASVLIVPLVYAVLKELIDQVTVGHMHFDAVETGLAGVLRGSGKIVHDARNFLDMQSARHHVRPLRAQQTDTALAGDGDRKSTRLNSSHYCASRMPSSA